MAVAVAGTATVAETSSGTSITCSVPAGVTAGELLVAAVTQSSTAAIPNQSGWTQAAQGQAPTTALATAVFYRVATGSEPASYTFTGLVSGRSAAEMVRLSGAPTISVLDAAPVTGGSSSTTTFTMPSITTASAGGLVLSAIAANATSTPDITAASGNPATIIKDTTGTGRRTILAAETRAAAGVVGTRAWQTTSSVGWAGVSVAFKPASAASTSVTVNGTTALATAATDAGSLTAGAVVSTTVTGAAAAATAAATAGTPVVPHLTITVTPEPASSPPRVRIDIADTRFMPATTVTLSRRNPNGRTSPVRTPDGGPLLLSGGTATIWDYEAPYGVPVTYFTDAAGSNTASTELDVDDVWLLHPGVPSFSQQIKVTALPQRTRATTRGLHQVQDRADPIPISSGVRQTAASTLGLRTYTDAQRQALDTLTDDDAVLLLNIPPSKPWGWDTCYVSLGDLTEARTAAYGRFPYREWQAPIQVVGRPGGGTQAGITWDDVASQYPTWQAIVDAGVTTWADLAAPTG